MSKVPQLESNILQQHEQELAELLANFPRPMVFGNPYHIRMRERFLRIEAEIANLKSGEAKLFRVYRRASCYHEQALDVIASDEETAIASAEALTKSECDRWSSTKIVSPTEPHYEYSVERFRLK
jgi:hypothetical protein